MTTRHVMLIAWPAFLLAGVLEILVFAAVDPMEILWVSQGLLESRQSVYGVSFFVFWLVIAASNAVSLFLANYKDS